MYDLMAEFDKRYDPILQQVEELKGELDALISDTSFKLELRQLGAKVQVMDGEILRLTSEGRFEEADGKKSERVEIEDHVHNLTSTRKEKIDDLEKRISSLLNQKKPIADEILREGFISIRKEALGCLEEAIDFFDSMWKEIETFQRQTGAQAPGVGPHNFKIYPSSDQRELHHKLSKWVHMVPNG